MSLDQIKTFVVVAQEGSVRKAADKLHISQPPLSRQIARLEDELGHKLFTRQPRGMVLSDAGAVFFAHARGILDAVTAARTALAAPDPLRAITPGDGVLHGGLPPALGS